MASELVRSSALNSNQTNAHAMDEQYETLIRELLVAEGFDPDQTTVELNWVTKARSQSLNRRYRAIDKPTDVLSFPLYSYRELEDLKKGREPILLGSLILCRPIITAYARLNQTDPATQVDWSIRHGLRHLFGYDHDEQGKTWRPING